MSTSATVQAEVDRQNSRFWNELCGTKLARDLGIVGFSKAELEKFDRHYLAFYPYLPDYLRLDELNGKDVLEVGLGYGTVAQQIAQAGARYTGLDVAQGPVDLVNQRLELCGAQARAVRGSILEAPFPDRAFDAVIAIGSLHHTGNLRRAIDEVHRLLRNGGRAVVMVYNAFSYRRWLLWPRETWAHLATGQSAPVTAAQRAAYDPGGEGGAPETVFTSASELRRMCGAYSSCSVSRENADRESILRFVPRAILLPTIGRTFGLDLYAELIK